MEESLARVGAGDGSVYVRTSPGAHDPDRLVIENIGRGSRSWPKYKREGKWRRY